MKQYLPSKKFISLLGSIVFVLLLLWGVNAIIKYQNRTKTIVSSNVNLTKEQIMIVDTDGDGLKDWEEALWKTDPYNPDTDGDGTPDGEEVRLNRDPTKANTAGVGEEPNDKIDPTLIAESKKKLAVFEELSETDRLARTLFADYIAAKNGDLSTPLSNTNKTIILQNAINNFEALPVKIYTQNDIRTFTPTNTAEIKAYGNALGNISQVNTPKNTEYELTIFARALTNETPTELDKLTPIIIGYQNISAGFLTVPAPAEIAVIQVNLINDFQKIQTSLEKMQKIFSDPTPAISALQLYNHTVPNMIKNISALNTYFYSKGVVFNPGEPGYMFQNII